MILALKNERLNRRRDRRRLQFEPNRQHQRRIRRSAPVVQRGMFAFDRYIQMSLGDPLEGSRVWNHRHTDGYPTGPRPYHLAVRNAHFQLGAVLSGVWIPLNIGLRKKRYIISGCR
jgi:hypothetical protein